MFLDGCDRLLSFQYFRTLPVGYILGCLLILFSPFFIPLFYFDSKVTPETNLVIRRVNHDFASRH